MPICNKATVISHPQLHAHTRARASLVQQQHRSSAAKTRLRPGGALKNETKLCSGRCSTTRSYGTNGARCVTTKTPLTTLTSRCCAHCRRFSFCGAAGVHGVCAGDAAPCCWTIRASTNPFSRCKKLKGRAQRVKMIVFVFLKKTPLRQSDGARCVDVNDLTPSTRVCLYTVIHSVYTARRFLRSAFSSSVPLLRFTTGTEAAEHPPTHKRQWHTIRRCCQPLFVALLLLL